MVEITRRGFFKFAVASLVTFSVGRALEVASVLASSPSQAPSVKITKPPTDNFSIQRLNAVGDRVFGLVEHNSTVHIVSGQIDVSGNLALTDKGILPVSPINSMNGADLMQSPIDPNQGLLTYATSDPRKPFAYQLFSTKDGWETYTPGTKSFYGLSFNSFADDGRYAYASSGSAFRFIVGNTLLYSRIDMLTDPINLLDYNVWPWMPIDYNEQFGPLGPARTLAYKRNERVDKWGDRYQQYQTFGDVPLGYEAWHPWISKGRTGIIDIVFEDNTSLGALSYAFSNLLLLPEEFTGQASLLRSYEDQNAAKHLLVQAQTDGMDTVADFRQPNGYPPTNTTTLDSSLVRKITYNPRLYPDPASVQIKDVVVGSAGQACLLTWFQLRPVLELIPDIKNPDSSSHELDILPALSGAPAPYVWKLYPARLGKRDYLVIPLLQGAYMKDFSNADKAGLREVKFTPRPIYRTSFPLTHN